MRFIVPVLLCGCLLSAPPAFALSLSDFTQSQMDTGVKEALQQGALNAVLRLGKDNGFLGYDKVRIPLPPALKKAEKVLRTFGMKKQADELVQGMNNAAEKAVPEAKELFIDAVKQMSIQDAKNLLTGSEDAATQYFRKATEGKLREKFLPIVTNVTNNIGLAAQYNKFAGSAAQLGVVNTQDAKIEDYVTRKALDGLFLVMAEEERAIRQNPVQAGSDLVKRIYGVIKR